MTTTAIQFNFGKLKTVKAASKGKAVSLKKKIREGLGRLSRLYTAKATPENALIFNNLLKSTAFLNSSVKGGGKTYIKLSTQVEMDQEYFRLVSQDIDRGDGRGEQPVLIMIITNEHNALKYTMDVRKSKKHPIEGIKYTQEQLDHSLATKTSPLFSTIVGKDKEGNVISETTVANIVGHAKLVGSKVVKKVNMKGHIATMVEHFEMSVADTKQPVVAFKLTYAGVAPIELKDHNVCEYVAYFVDYDKEASAALSSLISKEEEQPLSAEEEALISQFEQADEAEKAGEGVSVATSSNDEVDEAGEGFEEDGVGSDDDDMVDL